MAIIHLNSSANQAGVIQEDPGIALTHTVDAQQEPFAVTAAATDSGDLRLIAWRLPERGKGIVRFGDSSNSPAGPISAVAIAKAGHNLFTGVRAASGKLKLIAWRLDVATGNIARLTESGEDQPAGQISLAPSPLGDGRLLVAFRNGFGNLVLQNWILNSSGELAKVETPGDPVSRVALGTIGKRAFTAVRDGDGKLKINLWDISSNGVLTHLGDSGQQGEPISLVDAVTLGNLIVTSVRDAQNNLKIISWNVSDGGNTVSRKDDSGTSAGSTDRLAIVAMPLTNVSGVAGRVFTAVRTNANRLKVIAWSIADSGAITRAEDFADVPGTVDVIAMDSVPGTFVTAVRDENGHLRLDTWDFNTRMPPHGLPENIVISNVWSFENTAQVITPPAVPQGRIVLVRGQKSDDKLTPKGYVTRELLNGNGAEFAITAPEQDKTFMVTSAFQQSSILTPDNQVIRLHDGTLMSSRNAHIWTNLTPSPPWFNTVDFTTHSTGQQRNAVIIFVSNDHGANWRQRSHIDSAVDANGDFGWPQGHDDGSFTAGGFDRTELYQDPWTRHIYIAGSADGGPYKKNGFNEDHHGCIVFRSTDNGATWQELARLPKRFSAPCVMTSTPYHPLVMLTREGNLPKLFWLEKDASSLSGGESVAVREAGNLIEWKGDKGIGEIRKAPPCIARIRGREGRDNLWIAYPALSESGRQVYKLCVVGFGGAAGEPAGSELLTTIESVDPGSRLVCMGAFVQDDSTAPGANPDNLTMFYWVDAPPETASDPNGLLVRSKILFGTRGHFQSGYLSVHNGQKREFDRIGIGDYFKGAYFELNGKVHFLAHWSESNGVFANVVSV